MSVITDSSVCVVLVYRPRNRSTDIIGVYPDCLTAKKRVAELRKCYSIAPEDVVTFHTEAVWRYPESESPNPYAHKCAMTCDQSRNCRFRQRLSKNQLPPSDDEQIRIFDAIKKGECPFFIPKKGVVDAQD